MLIDREEGKRRKRNWEGKRGSEWEEDEKERRNTQSEMKDLD